MRSQIRLPKCEKLRKMGCVRTIHARLLACGLLTSLALAGCSQAPTRGSDIKVTDVKHTSIKRQSIGNCWLYAESTWLESMLKSYAGKEINVSESYWTWWHWYSQLTKPGFDKDEIETAGSWYTAASIIQNHGWVLAADFVPQDSTMEMSVKQEDALNEINAQLSDGGRLDTAEKRTPAKVRAELDKAFGTNMAHTQTLAQSAATTKVAKDFAGEVSLLDALTGPLNRRWQPLKFPADEAGRKATLARVFRALNDYKPVLMSIDVDFNAIDKSDDGAFKKSILDTAGKPGDQGGHMVVLKDYTVTGAPGFGALGAGDLPPSQKEAALHGDVASLIAKNSWGKNRTDRGMVDGFTTFYRDYLYGPIQWLSDQDDENSKTYPIVPLESFVMPPNY